MAEPGQEPASPRGAGQGSRRLAWLPGLNLTLLIALIGMATGLTSLYIGWQSNREESALRLSAYPSASLADITPQGLGVRVELVNESLRPIVLRSAQLLLDGEVVSTATSWVDDVAALDAAASQPARLALAQKTFPIGLRAREGNSVVLMMDVWSPVIEAASEEDKSAARGSFRQLTATLASLPTEGAESRLKLRLDHAPGGKSDYAVAAATVPTSSENAIESAGALVRRVPPRLWVVDRLARSGKLEGLTLRRRFAGADEIDLVTLDVWDVRSQLHRTLTRPVVARQQTLFPLTDLPKGAYIATFRLGDDVVAYTSFSVPTR